MKHEVTVDNSNLELFITDCSVCAMRKYWAIRVHSNERPLYQSLCFPTDIVFSVGGGPNGTETHDPGGRLVPGPRTIFQSQNRTLPPPSSPNKKTARKKNSYGVFFFHSILVLYIEFFSTRQNGDITHWTLHVARSVGPVSSNSPTCRCLACSGGRDSVSTEGFQKDVKYITVMIDTADVSKPLPQ